LTHGSDELELKFEVPAQSRVRLESALGRGRFRVDKFRAIYFDTAKGCLGSRGVSVRLRREGRLWVQTAKAATADPFRRLEHSAAVPEPADGSEPRLDLSLHDGAPVGKALRRAVERCGAGGSGAPLSEQFRTDVSRMSRTVRFAGARVALSFDRGTITAGGGTVPVCEFELELKTGDVASLIALAKRWAGAHGLWLRTASKAERGWRLAQGEPFGPPVRSSAAKMPANSNAAAFLVATIRSCLMQVLGNASEIAAGALDDELVHQLRVGLLHLRTVLNELHADRLGADSAWVPVLHSAFRELGVHRDREVVLPNVLAELFEHGCPPLQHLAPAATARSPSDVARDPVLQQTLLRVLAFVHTPPECKKVNACGCGSARSMVAGTLEKLHRLIARDFERFGDLKPARQHRLRKRLGRLLCIAAAAESLFERKRVERCLEGLGRARSFLGKSNDLQTARESLRAGRLQGRGARFADGWLKVERDRNAKLARRALRASTNKAVFWSR